MSFGAIGVVGTALWANATLPSWAANTLLTTSEWFTAGMLLAVLSVALERRRTTPPRLEALLRRAWVFWIAAAALVVVAYHWFDVYHLRDYLHPPPVHPADAAIHFLLFAAAAGCVLVPALFGAGGLIRRLLATRWLSFLGVISYGMYLYHWPLEAWLADFRGPPPVRYGWGIETLIGSQRTLVYMVCTLVLAALAGTLSYYVVELPFLRLKEGGSGFVSTLLARRARRGVAS